MQYVVTEVLLKHHIVEIPDDTDIESVIDNAKKTANEFDTYTEALKAAVCKDGVFITEGAGVELDGFYIDE